MRTIKSFQDLEVYNIARSLAQNVFEISKKFPREEKYSLTDQIRRSSRSVSANIAEGWGKRIYINEFKKYLINALGSLEETKSWLNACLDCSYISRKEYDILMSGFDFLGGKIYNLHKNWK